MLPAIAAAASSRPRRRGLAAALEDNRGAVDEAKTLGAPCLVLVVGSLPGALAGKPPSTDIGLARAQVFDGIAATLEMPGAGMPLAIEPLHPMQAADRACINTLEQALDICDALDPAAPARSASRSTSITCGGTPSSPPRSPAPGRNRLLAYHVCDWLVPTRDLLNDRGMMGDGIIELRKVRGWWRRRATRARRGRDLLRGWWSRPPTRCWTPAWRGTRRWCDSCGFPLPTLQWGEG